MQTGRLERGSLDAMTRGSATRAAPSAPGTLDCVVCGDHIALDDEVVVVWSNGGDVPTAVSLARCQDRIPDRGDRISGPYPLRKAIGDILTAARARPIRRGG
jgi:hypothetical protein